MFSGEGDAERQQLQWLLGFHQSRVGLEEGSARGRQRGAGWISGQTHSVKVQPAIHQRFVQSRCTLTKLQYTVSITLNFPFLCKLHLGLISQFSANLHEAQLVSHASKCQHNTSLCNEHSNQEELLKAVLLAGLFPNLIQVHGKFSAALILQHLHVKVSSGVKKHTLCLLPLR